MKLPKYFQSADPENAHLLLQAVCCNSSTVGNNGFCNCKQHKLLTETNTPGRPQRLPVGQIP
jgi:hypothetical protein